MSPGGVSVSDMSTSLINYKSTKYEKPEVEALDEKAYQSNLSALSQKLSNISKALNGQQM